MRKSIMGFGNPLMDISLSIKGNEFYGRYGLKPDGHKEISHHDMQQLLKDVEGFEQHISPGGCVLNSFRVLQWVCQQRHDVFFYGSVGHDLEANMLKSILNSQGINARFSIQENLPTGKTVALANGPKRSLVAHIGAAEVFPLNFIQSDEFLKTIKSCDLVYVESFFLPNRVDVGRNIADLCGTHKKILAVNLCGEYIFDVVPDAIIYLVKYADIVFGNKEEFEALRKLLKRASFEEMASYIINNSNKNFILEGKKLLLITDGPNEIVCVNKNGTILRVQPDEVDQKNLKDTIGAGDAFVGGFLAGFCSSRKLIECVNLGIYCSKTIIQQFGCTIPKYKPEVNL